EKNGGILIMNKEKALKNQGLEFREDIVINGGVQYELIAVILPEVLCVSCRVRQTCYAAAEMAVA
ncbi:hypothetical protein, partial [Blautia wexlerae]